MTDSATTRSDAGLRRTHFLPRVKSQCGALEWARASASVPHLRRVQVLKSSGVLDLSRGISNRSWKDRDPLWIQQDAAVAARFPKQADGFVSCASGKRRMTGEQLVHYCAKSVNIGGTGELSVITNRLFWCHVTWRAQNLERAS